MMKYLDHLVDPLVDRIENSGISAIIGAGQGR